MDPVICEKATFLFGDSYKQWNSPMKTTFIKGFYQEKEYLVSYNPKSGTYVMTENDKYLCGGCQKEEILQALENLLNNVLHPISDTTRLMSAMTGFPLAY